MRRGDRGGLRGAGRMVAALGVTAVSDGVGGAALGRLMPRLPLGTTLGSYGFLAGPEPVAFPTSLLIERNLVRRPFSSFATATVRDLDRLAATLRALEAIGAAPPLRTRLGARFAPEQIAAAMADAGPAGAKAVLQFG